MSCVWSVTRPRLLAAIAILLIAGSQYALAQSILCVAIRPGETAERVAKRITGDATNTRQPWFQILNPATSRFVSKSTYDRIHSDWRACVVNEPLAMPRSPVNAGWDLAAFVQAVPWLQNSDADVVLWGLLVVTIALGSHGLAHYLRQRATALAAMKQFAERFIREFERPLMLPHVRDRPVQWRCHFAPHRARLEVWLAPHAGRRYPNLTDHAKNLEYDVMRILTALKDQRFVHGRAFAEGRWVVVPFQLTRVTKAGRK